MIHIARCPEHGLHGERTECFVCGGPVEQVPMVPVPVMADPETPPEMAPNQHDERINAASTRIALLAALDYWEIAGCDCCCPTVLDDAIDAIGYEVKDWERFRRFGIELAQTAQNIIDGESEDDASGQPTRRPA